MIDKYRQPSHVQRASLMSATLAGIRLRALRISAENFAAIQTLTTALVLTLTRAAHAGRPRRASAAPTVCDRRLLWRFGISGDRPLLLVSAGAPQGLGLLRSLAQALRLWSWGGVACDLVVVNAEPASYLMALQRELAALRERHGADSGGQPPARGASTGLHLLRADELSADELSTLQQPGARAPAGRRPAAGAPRAGLERAARAGARAAPRHLDRRPVPVAAPARRADAARRRARSTPARASSASTSSAAQRPPRPWINVLANPAFGAQLSEAGGGYTWAVNSRLNQLTAWSNDPVADPPARVVPAAGPPHARGLERRALGLGRRATARPTASRMARATA